MRARRALAASLLLSIAAAVPAFAEDAADSPFGTALPADTLAGLRGGADTTPSIAGSILQGNSTNQSGTNLGDISVSNDAAKLNGAIYAATINGNQGLTSVMQNTGDLVNLSNATSINIYLH